LRKECLRRSKVKEILSVTVTLTEMVVMTLFWYVYNAVRDQLCGCLDGISLLVGDVKLRVISLNKVKG